MLPLEMKKMEDPNIFKTKTKEWIWENIPLILIITSYLLLTCYLDIAVL